MSGCPSTADLRVGPVTFFRRKTAPMSVPDMAFSPFFVGPLTLFVGCSAVFGIPITVFLAPFFYFRESFCHFHRSLSAFSRDFFLFLRCRTAKRGRREATRTGFSIVMQTEDIQQYRTHLRLSYSLRKTI